jgi:hypothetical protein
MKWRGNCRARTGGLVVLLLVGSVGLTGCGGIDPTASTTNLYINEILAQNDTVLADTEGNGGYPDWIELYNAGATAVDLSGMYLTDDFTNPTKWRIPDGVSIAAHGYVLFWADNDTDQGKMHTNFALSTAGEQIGLFDTAERDYAKIDAVTFGVQTADVSYGRTTDGAATWRKFVQPTPGDANQ